jgi:hypothetical protein
VVSLVEATVETVKATISLIPGMDLMGEEAKEEDTAFLGWVVSTLIYQIGGLLGFG